jgi:hypothetical protein
MVTKDISELPNDIIQGIIRDAVFATHAFILQNTPVAKSTPADPPYTESHTGGRLRQSIVVEKTDDGWIIGTKIPYAEYVEVGVDPHEIVATDKEALKFYTANGFIFAKSVMHPGFEGRHMFLNGIDFFEKYIADRLSR